MGSSTAAYVVWPAGLLVAPALLIEPSEAMMSVLRDGTTIADDPAIVWLEIYRGHRIAMLRAPAGWRVACDQVVYQEMCFDDPDEAAAWVKRRVDDRIAEAIFPGLALTG